MFAMTIKERALPNLRYVDLRRVLRGRFHSMRGDGAI
jgi:hypothetical protein